MKDVPSKTATQCAYLTIAQYAQALGVSEKTVRRELKKGNVPHKKVGKLFRIPKSTIASLPPHSSI